MQRSGAALRQARKLNQTKKKLIVYKKAVRGSDGQGFVIITLEIPASAQRVGPSNEFGNEGKCRCSKAKVLSIVDMKTRGRLKEAFSSRDNWFRYRVGATVKPRFRFDRSGDTCSSGIHYFLTRQEAKDYCL